MTKFKPSTHALIDQTVKELLLPKLEVGRTYCFKYLDNIVKRNVIEVDEKLVTYGKPTGVEVTCSIKAFQRLYQQHGVTE